MGKLIFPLTDLEKNQGFISKDLEKQKNKISQLIEDNTKLFKENVFLK